MSPAVIVTAVGTVQKKDVIATQAITYLPSEQFLCLSPRQILSSEERDRARRRLLVPLSLSSCGGSVSKSLLREAHIFYILLII